MIELAKNSVKDSHMFEWIFMKQMVEFTLEK